MKSFAKTIRFYDTHKDQVAIKAISNFAEYGFSSANEMVVTALYELAERHNNHSSNELPLDELADNIVARLGGNVAIVSGTTEANPSSCVSSGPETWDTPEPATDENISDVMADILSFYIRYNNIYERTDTNGFYEKNSSYRRHK